MFEGNLELIIEGFLEISFGEPGMFDEEGDRNLTIGVIVQVDLCGVCGVDVFLRRDHSGRVEIKLRNRDKMGCRQSVRKTLSV